MTTAAEVINQARGWIGATEEPPGSNNVPGITDWYGFPGPWCAMAVSRWLSDAGLPTHVAWVGNLLYEQGWTRVDPADIEAGDVPLHDFPGGVMYDHTDLVESRDGDELTCIDGNWGDACVRVIRHVGDASIQNGAVMRPPYDVAPVNPPSPPDDHVYTATIDMPTIRKGSTGKAVRQLQVSLGLDADGDFGPQTEASVVAAQRALGLADDGVVGPQTWTAVLQGLLAKQGYKLTQTGDMDSGTAASLGDWEHQARLPVDYIASYDVFYTLTAQG